MTASRPDRAPIAVFDRDVMAVAAAGAPDVMDRIAANVLGPLDELPDHEREALLDTLEAWFDHGGSAERAAQQLYVHPNTCGNGCANSSTEPDGSSPIRARLPNCASPCNLRVAPHLPTAR